MKNQAAIQSLVEPVRFCGVNATINSDRRDVDRVEPVRFCGVNATEAGSTAPTVYGGAGSILWGERNFFVWYETNPAGGAGSILWGERNKYSPLLHL